MQISLAIVNYDLEGLTMEQARHLVRTGERRWVRTRLATLKLVVPGYKLGTDEQFVVEGLQGWSPE